MADSGKLSFVELMEKQPSYGPLMDKPVIYQLTALYNGRYWSLAIKGNQPDLPYVTVELILSDDGKTIVRAVRLVDYKEDELHLLNPKPVGTYGPDKTLRELCRLGDETFEEACNNKWQEFTTTYLAKLDIPVQLPTTTTSYYTIEVEHGSGYQECYLGTQFNDMRFPTEVRDGNISVYWNCDPDAFESSVINAVTEQSTTPTYMQLGASISRKPMTYQVTLTGPATNFYFMSSSDLYLVYAIATMASDGNMTYLKPQDSGTVVAVAQTLVPHVFRITPQTSVPFTFPSTT